MVLSPPSLFASAKLLAFIREESLGNTYGRAIRRALDEAAQAALAQGVPTPRDGAGVPLPLERWPLELQVAALVPVGLRRYVRPGGKVPSPSVYNDRPEGIRQVIVPLSPEERVTARIAAFGQFSSLARWGAGVLEDELRRLLPDRRELWRLPHQEQVEALLPAEPAAWPTAVAMMDQDFRRATRTLWNHEKLPDPGADFALPSEPKKEI